MAKLSKLESRILDLMHKGKTHAEIGRIVGLNPKEVHDIIIYIWQVKSGIIEPVINE